MSLVAPFQCRWCQSDQLAVELSGKDYWVTKRDFRLVRCQRCNLIQTEVEISPHFFDEVYPQAYYAHTEEHLRPGLRERVQTASMRLQAGQQVGVVEGLLARLLRPFVLVELPYLAAARVLDVGSGAGKLLNVAKQNGFETYSVEPDENARQLLARAGHIAYAALEETDFPADFFDLVVFNQSLEHVPQPLQTLQFAAQLLKPGGQMILSVPNYDCTERRAFRQYWRHLDIPRHLCHFTPQTLSALAGTVGLECVKRKYKFWGLPISSLRVARREEGKKAYLRLAQYLLWQFWAYLTMQPTRFGSMMAYYFIKQPSR